jgi:hypothetical protein
MENKLVAEVRQTGADILRMIDSFEDDNFNVVPFEGSWTAGQVSEHLLLSGGAAEVVFGNTEPANRPADQHIGELRIFLDFSIKMKSPDFIIPGNGPFQKTIQLDKLQDVWVKLNRAATDLDLSLLCKDFEMPMLGLLTRFEWISFYVFHTKRHLNQLKNSKASLMQHANSGSAGAS